jgi:hypothetical protein
MKSIKTKIDWQILNPLHGQVDNQLKQLYHQLKWQFYYQLYNQLRERIKNETD